MRRNLLSLIVLLILGTSSSRTEEKGATNWPVYGGDPGGRAYSDLDQISAANIERLQRAWTYRTGESGLWENTPVVASNVLYFVTQRHRIIAIDATTGRELWTYDPKQNLGKRGVTYWPGDASTPPRIFVGGSVLIALDARTGQPVETFGSHGTVNVRAGVADGYPGALYSISSPPAVYKNLIIVGPATQEGPSKGPSGDPRAFDARTGQLVWRFHTVPQPGELGNETWGAEGWKDRSGPSQWGHITIDAERGTAFIPVGNAADGFYGADRKGTNLYANSVVALDATTGRLKWYFQLVHHDIFDFDVAAPPALVEATVGGRKVPAVAEISKSGLLYVLDRETGKPIFPVEERPVPESRVPGEVAWPTQPFPAVTPPLARLTMTREEVSNVTPEAHAYCLQEFDKLTHRGPFTPMGLEPTLIFPSAIGGANWAGVSFDPRRGYVFVNTSSLGQTGQLAPSESDASVYRIRNAYGRFVDPQGHPCNAPPWGELGAVDMASGRVVWRVPLGVYEDLEARGITNTGAVNLGGSLATAGGLVFIAATNDSRFRAFDSATGKRLWEKRLDGSGNNSPITYRGNDGRQYVVLVSGGAGRAARAIGVRTSPTPSEPTNDEVVAFALPK
jgi:glucose dehydrogenase